MINFKKGALCLMALVVLGLSSCKDDVFSPLSHNDAIPEYQIKYYGTITSINDGKPFTQALAYFRDDEGFPHEIEDGTVLYNGTQMNYTDQGDKVYFSDPKDGFPAESTGTFVFNSDDSKTYTNTIVLNSSEITKYDPTFQLDKDTLGSVSFSPALTENETIYLYLVKESDQDQNGYSIYGKTNLSTIGDDNTKNLGASQLYLTKLNNEIKNSMEPIEPGTYEIFIERSTRQDLTQDFGTGGRGYGIFQSKPEMISVANSTN